MSARRPSTASLTAPKAATAAVILAFLSPLGLTKGAAAAQEGWYVIGNFGQINVPAPGLEEPIGTTPEEDDYFSGAFGFRQGSFRAEGQFLYSEFDEESFGDEHTLKQSTADLFPLEDVIGQDAGSAALMANGYYDYSVTARWRFFAGAGLGFARMTPELGADSYVPSADLDSRAQEGDAHFAYQGMLGLSYQLNDPFEVFVGYRFFGAENLGLSSDQDSNADDPEGYAAHSGLIGFRYNF